MLSFMESDGNDIADVEERSAKVASALADAISLVPGLDAVAVPANIVIGAVTEVFQALKKVGATSNDDDPLGSVMFELRVDGKNTWLSQPSVVAGTLVETPVNGKPARIEARLQGSGADYSVTILVDGAVTKQTSAGLTVEPPLSQELTPDDFVSWRSADANGATGTLHGNSVTLSGPMGTAFYLHDDYPNFNRQDFTPQMPNTGMVEIQGAQANTFTLTFQTPVADPVILLGSLGSVMTFPPGTQVSEISGDDGFHAAGQRDFWRGGGSGRTGRPDRLQRDRTPQRRLLRDQIRACVQLRQRRRRGLLPDRRHGTGLAVIPVPRSYPPYYGVFSPAIL